MGIIINHDKDPYEPTSTMECNKGFFRGSPGFYFNFALEGVRSESMINMVDRRTHSSKQVEVSSLSNFFTI